MSCKCSTSSPSIGTRAAMCQVCRYSNKSNGSAVLCTINRQKVVEIAFDTATPCPINRFDTTVRWMGVEWSGVPEPIRWVLTWQLGRVPIGLEGCGCITKVKESRIGKYLEPWLEGIPLLRSRFASLLLEIRGL